MKITTASFNAKLSCYMYKESIYVNIFYCTIIIYVYAYFIIDIIMHILYILSFICFNKHYIVHLNAQLLISAHTHLIIVSATV